MTGHTDGKQQPKKVSPLARVFGGIFGVLSWLLLSLLVSVVVEWVGMFTFWPEESVNHSRDMFRTELTYVNETLVNNLFVDAPRDTLAELFETVDARSDTVGSGARWLDEKLDSFLISNSPNLLQSLVLSATFIFKTFLLRLLILSFGSPIFVLAAWAAVVDGLVERELRKAGNARESNLIFDFAVDYSYWIVVLMAICYLSSPVASNPLYFFIPGAVLFFLLVHTTCASYKKYT